MSFYGINVTDPHCFWTVQPQTSPTRRVGRSIHVISYSNVSISPREEAGRDMLEPRSKLLFRYGFWEADLPIFEALRYRHGFDYWLAEFI